MRPKMMRGLAWASSDERAAATLTATASIGNTSVTVDDPYQFDEDGGKIRFGRGGEVVTFSAVNDTTKVLTTAALAANHAIGDVLWPYPLNRTRYASIQVEGDEGDAVQAVVPHHMYDRLPVGAYDEPVACEFQRAADTLDLVVRRVYARGGTAQIERPQAVFTAGGTLVAKVYAQGWIADQRYNFTQVRARCGLHDSGTHPSDGCPTGSALQVNLRIRDDASLDTNIFTADTRLQIAASTHKDTAAVIEGDAGFNRTYIEANETMYVKVVAVGSTLPGSDLVVEVFMEADA